MHTPADRSHDAAGGPSTGEEPTIACVDVRKSFGHVDALRGATIAVPKGKVTALFGDNGAGKSTLLRVLCGMYTPDSGEVLIEGTPVKLRSIRDAHSRGIDVIHQDLALAPDLSVTENVYLGHEELYAGWRHAFGVLARRRMGTSTAAAIHELGIDLPSVLIPVQQLSGGQRQAVAVARAVMWSRLAILMDEPTAALSAKQSDTVCATIKQVAAKGLGVFVISHDIPRMLEIADTAAVLRRGQVVLEAPAQELTITDVVHAMVGDIER